MYTSNVAIEKQELFLFSSMFLHGNLRQIQSEAFEMLNPPEKKKRRQRASYITQLKEAFEQLRGKEAQRECLRRKLHRKNPPEFSQSDMGEQRQPFRFRIPWLSGTTTPRVAAGTQPPRSATGRLAPSQPAAATSVPRLPIRPPEIAQATPPPLPPPPPAQVPLPPRPASQPQSPPIPRPSPEPTMAPKLEEPTLAADRPQVTSPPPTQSPAVPRTPPISPQVQKLPEVKFQPTAVAPVVSAASQSTTPIAARPQPKAPSLPPSPSPKASPKPSPRGPSLRRSEEEPVAEPQPSPLAPKPPKETLPQPSSPAQKAVLPLPESASLSPPLTEKSLSPTPISKPPLEPPVKAETRDESTSRPGNDYPIKAPAKPDATTMQVAPLTRSPTADIAKIEPPAQSERLSPMSMKGADLSGEASEEAKETKDDGEQFPKQERIRGQDGEEPLKGKLTAGSRLGMQIKEPPTVASPGEQKQKQETSKVASVTTTASDSHGKHTRAPKSTHFPRGRHMVRESHEKPAASRGDQSSLHKEIREDVLKLVHKLTSGQTKKTPDDKPISIITIAGENRGALMRLTSESAKKEGSIHIHRGYKTDPDESPEATTDTERSSKPKSPKTEQEPGVKVFINSNVQTVNNSMVLESSISKRNPGVQMELSPNNAEEVEPSNQIETSETRKAESSLTPSEKLTYEPTIRRRCLRGLFLESSDSDPENPTKPRRHGCRYSCAGATKEKDVNIT